MRLTCPNCDAQYEVEDNVIPKEGRDVQCSSCERTWFQKSAHQQEEEEVAAIFIHDDPAPLQQKPDESVLEVLREEAERETKARIDERRPGSGSDQARAGVSPLAATIRERKANSKEGKSKIDAVSLGLPDIDELNSTLKARAADREAELKGIAEAPTNNRRGFRLGFGLVLLLGMLLALAYIKAPWIIEKLPQSEPYVTGYVEKMNDLRVWLDQTIKLATDKMTGSSGTDS